MESRAPRRQIVHVDLDAFFVSVERLLAPELEGRPVIVGGSPGARGVVASASYEAREHGVRSAQPTAQALRLCPQATLLRPRFGLYREVSGRVMDLLGELTPLVEVASVDEAYLELSGTERLLGPPAAAARRLKQRLRAELGLPATVTLATSKLVAKVAAAQAKPDGFLVVPPGGEPAFLAPLPVGLIPGVGPRAQGRLAVLGLGRIADLQRAGPAALRQVLGREGEILHRMSMGLDPRPVEPQGRRLSLGHEATFPRDLHRREELEARLASLAASAAGDLWREGLQGRRVELKLRYADFRTASRSRTLPQPTSEEGAIAQAAVELFRRTWSGQPIRLLGVRVSQLVAGRAYQLGLGEEGRPRSAVLEELSQELRRRFGPAAPRRASLWRWEGED